ncbi:MAG: T9SS type A sorting domain-containing protein [Bacteroidetes bacterium]|nr:T9SS type A sorting domain-containing protein [Bacteroidota bacterium]
MKRSIYSLKLLKSSPFLLLILSVCSLALNAQTTWQIGTGTTSNDQYTYPTPYGNWYSGMHTQFLYTAAELTAAGMTPGTIDQLAFNLTATNGAQPLQSYNISIKGTTTTNTNSFQTTGLTLVYTSPSLSPTVGWNTYTLSTPFNWNGTDNILIDICFWNNANNYTYNGSVQWTTNAVAGVNTSIWYRSDSGGPFCTSTSVTGTSTTRPNIKFTRLLGPPTNFMSNPSSACSGAQVTLSADGFGNNATANWAGPGIQPNTSTPATGGAASYTFYAPVVTTPTTYTYSVTQTVGATTSPSVTTQITVNPLPVFNNNSPTNSSPVCENGTLSFNAETTPAGVTYSWTGPGFGAPATGASPTIQNVPLSAAGMYTVTVGTAAGCTVTDSTFVTINPAPTVSFPSLSPICSGDSMEVLTGATPAGGTYSGLGVTNGMFNPQYGTQTLTYTYTDSNGCSNAATTQQIVNPSPAILLAQLPELCSNSLPLTLYGGVPSGGFFTGPDINNGVFTQTGAGTYPVTYNYTDSNIGCTAHITLPLIVHDANNTGLAGSVGNTESAFIVQIPATTEVRYTPDCDLMAVIDPVIPGPIGPNTTVKVTLDGSVNVGVPYVPRHYNISSAGNAFTGNANITLYAYQSEFDAYNAVAAGKGLPLLPTGADNGNVRVTIFQSYNNTPDPTAPQTTVTPSVTWDAAHGWWVMTMPVSRLGAFFIHTRDLTLNTANIASSNNGDMQVYPNPAIDKVNVNISGNRAKNAHLSVTDLAGRLLINVPMDDSKAVVDMSSLASGVYMVNYSDDERKETVKLTKQ